MGPIIKFWGKHVILTARNCHPQSIRCLKTIELFSSTLVQNIDMVPYGTPQIVHFGEDDKKGYTLVQLIETSNIVCHFVEEHNDMHLDVFSCKDFNPYTVESTVRQHFYPSEIQTQTLLR